MAKCNRFFGYSVLISRPNKNFLVPLAWQFCYPLDVTSGEFAVRLQISPWWCSASNLPPGHHCSICTSCLQALLIIPSQTHAYLPQTFSC